MPCSTQCLEVEIMSPGKIARTKIIYTGVEFKYDSIFLLSSLLTIGTVTDNELAPWILLGSQPKPCVPLISWSN